jgi:protein gp37
MMAENSKIEWCDHTFNPWMGCTRVSPGCQHCYAETMMDHRYGKVKWGPQGKRIRTAKQYWKQPLKWNNTLWVECDVCGFRQVFDEHGRCPECQHPMVATMRRVRQRVFCGSLCDVFEDRPDTFLWRDDLFQLIEQTPNLDWLLLTKRPENVKRSLPDNVWVGTSVEDQKFANKRIIELMKIPATVRFLSCEPLLGPLDLSGYLKCLTGDYETPMISWVICGGESGPDARPMNPDWVRSLRDQCLEADVPFFFKQWGEWFPKNDLWMLHLKEGITFKKKPVQFGDEIMVPVGKHRAGNFLDGLEWQEFPILNRKKLMEGD